MAKPPELDPMVDVCPVEAVQKFCVDPKNWFGLTKDGWGNFIGIDLNPGPNSMFRQVIVFRKYYYDAIVVIAKPWKEFLNRVVKDL